MSRNGAGAAGTEELRQEVDRARHDLGETVEALAARADVKAIGPRARRPGPDPGAGRDGFGAAGRVVAGVVGERGGVVRA
ncbi:DUF3618 domain-containing protein, partial [Actinomadura sp. CNU-125]|uniref:DUF3618 domain-containing protein n=1 Tax=Actinomadura sp. CNU-125 TaxID=1904961 RepID=UPI001178CB43